MDGAARESGNQVGEQITAMREQLDRAEKLNQAAEALLADVARPPSPPDSECGAGCEPQVVPLADQLRQFVTALEAVNDNNEDLYSRVEL